MSKLYFRYGAMSCGKTRDLLKTYYNYFERDMKPIIIKPKKDTKGEDKVLSRDNGSLKVDFLIDTFDDIYLIINQYLVNNNIDCILVDEAQFLEAKHIDQLSDVVDELDIPVLCFGLRTDFKTNLFEGSRRLFEIADNIEEIKTICHCGKKATMNVRMVDGNVTFEGEQVSIDGKDNVTYVSKCRKCRKLLRKNVKE